MNDIEKLRGLQVEIGNMKQIINIGWRDISSLLLLLLLLASSAGLLPASNLVPAGTGKT